jgi:hypothetical protein
MTPPSLRKTLRRRSSPWTLQETHKFSWARLFLSAGPRKYGCYFRRPRDRRKCGVFSWAGEYFRRQAHGNTEVIFVGLGADENVAYFRRPQPGRRKKSLTDHYFRRPEANENRGPKSSIPASARTFSHARPNPAAPPLARSSQSRHVAAALAPRLPSPSVV